MVQYSTQFNSQLVVGTIIVDGNGDIIDINQAATRLIAENQVLGIRTGRLVSTHPQVNRGLTKILTEVLKVSRSQNQLFCLKTMTIETEDGHIGVLIKSAIAKLLHMSPAPHEPFRQKQSDQ